MGKIIKVAQKADIQNNKMKELRVNGKTILVANVDGEFLAFDGICTHEHCELSMGYLDGYTLTCYCHGTQFDVKSGDVLSPPATIPLSTYKVKIEGEDILVEI